MTFFHLDHFALWSCGIRDLSINDFWRGRQLRWSVFPLTFLATVDLRIYFKRREANEEAPERTGAMLCDKARLGAFISCRRWEPHSVTTRSAQLGHCPRVPGLTLTSLWLFFATASSPLDSLVSTMCSHLFLGLRGGGSQSLNLHQPPNPPHSRAAATQLISF